MRVLARLSATAAILCGAPLAAAAQPTKPVVLDRGWTMQSSAKVPSGGDKVSTRGFVADKWYPVPMPSTVLGGLVANQVYKDIGVGMNLRSVPGTSYPIGRNFATLPMPADSPFHVGWWYRTEFDAPSLDKDEHLALHLDGVNYRANVWLNGKPVATSTDVAGMFRYFEFDVTRIAVRGANVLAIEVLPPEADDLAWTWVDWNPAPPDKNMGIFRPVWITSSGSVTARRSTVSSVVSPALTRADLTVSTELTNLSDRAVDATVSLRFDQGVLLPSEKPVAQTIALRPHEHRVVRFTADAFPALHITAPKLWWPVGMGEAVVNHAAVDVTVAGRSSDSQDVTFGIRTITSDVTDTGARLFKVNGRRVLIRGAGWASELLLRSNPVTQDAELAYVRDMHLNAIRLEGKLENERFFEQTDRLGLLVIAGWSCCDAWEQWSKWTPAHREVAEASLRDQIARLRPHPSLLVWLNGSDNPPPDDVERMYLSVLKDLEWPNPILSSATGRATAASGPTGVKMTGPYDWVPPSYWSTDTTRGGAFGFNTETSPGPAIPPIESLKRMLPPGHLWPIDDVWNFHAGGGRFTTIASYTDALNARYGQARSVEDFAAKSQLSAYEGERAMFEAFGRGKYTATGVVQWMLNNAWPSLIWHLYDFYLRPGGGYFGAKKANEAVHVQYSYDDRSIVVVNAGPRLNAQTVHARAYGLDSTKVFDRTITLDLLADNVSKALVLPAAVATSPTYFLDLRLTNDAGDLLSSNFYWLSAKPDVLDTAHANGVATPVTSYADFTGLESLPAAKVTNAIRVERRGANDVAHVTLENKGTSIAFFLRLQIMKGPKGEEVLPILWEDNFVSLLPGETRQISATYAHNALDGQPAALFVRGANGR
jgi:exo-1,4-beta-D-glucosaminidase